MSSTSNRERVLRPSRTSTPNHNEPHAWSHSTRSLSNNFFENRVATNGWVEPPLREPQPSFVDNKLDRLGVLETMMPLGTNPTAKQRARARVDPLRRHLGHKNVESLGLDDGRATPDFTTLSDGSRAASRAASVRADDSSVRLDTTPPLQVVSTPPAPSTTFSSPATPANLPGISSHQSPPIIGDPPVDPQILDQVTSSAVESPVQDSVRPKSSSATSRHLQESTSTLHPSPVVHQSPIANPPAIQSAPNAVTASQNLPQPVGRVLHTTTHIQPGSPFAKAIVEVKRRGSHHQVGALTYLHAASQKDHELAQLLLGESKGDLTPLMRKRLKRKIKDLKRSFKRSEPIPDFSGPGSTPTNPLGFTPGLHTSRSSTIGHSPSKIVPSLTHANTYSPTVSGTHFHNHHDSPISDHSNQVLSQEMPSLPRTNSLPMAATHSSHQVLMENLGSPLKPVAKGSMAPADAFAAELESDDLHAMTQDTPTKAAQDSQMSIDEAQIEAVPPLERRGSSPLSPPPASEPEVSTNESGLPPAASFASYDIPPPCQAFDPTNAIDWLQEPPVDDPYLMPGRSDLSQQESSEKRSAEEAFGADASADDARTRLERAMLREKDILSLESSERPVIVDQPISAVEVEVGETELALDDTLTPLITVDGSRPPSPQPAADTPEHGPTNLGRPPKRHKPQPPRTRVIDTNSRRTREGLTAGIAPMGRRDREAGYLEEADYNDICASCGSGGNLVCCVSCETAYHPLCREPPLDPKKPEAFFCNKCVERKRGFAERPHGLFSTLFERLEEKNPYAFRLPSRIATYFEGVKVGQDGQYVSVPEPRTNKRDKLSANGKDDDLHGLFKEVKGKNGKKTMVPALCCVCGLSAAGKKDLLPCEYCNLSWHLDCLDPPLAKAPSRNENSAWMCPNHVTHALQLVDAVELDKSRHEERLYPYHRIRKPAKHLVIDTHLQRGVPNNGLIEVHFDEESDDEFDVFEQDASGTLLRLPAKGIKLDFIEKVKSENAKHEAARKAELERLEIQKKRTQLSNAKHLNQRLRQHAFIERQTALNLAQFARGTDLAELSGDKIDGLVNLLEAEAPAEVARMMSTLPNQAQATTTGNPNLLAQGQRRQLELLQELISHVLKKS